MIKRALVVFGFLAVVACGGGSSSNGTPQLAVATGATEETSATLIAESLCSAWARCVPQVFGMGTDKAYPDEGACIQTIANSAAQSGAQDHASLCSDAEVAQCMHDLGAVTCGKWQASSTSAEALAAAIPVSCAKC